MMTMNNFKRLSQLFSLTMLLFITGAAQAVTLSFGSISQTGNSLSVDVNIAGLGSGTAPSVSTYDLDIQFDANHLSYMNSSFGDPVLGNQLDLFDFGINDTFSGTTGAGVLNIFELSLDLIADLNDLQADSFTLATLTFDVLQADTSQLGFLVNALGDAEGNSLATTLNTASVTTVPVPAAFWLMSSGLAILVKKNKVPLRGGITVVRIAHNCSRQNRCSGYPSA